jgi:hypothetical protein
MTAATESEPVPHGVASCKWGVPTLFLAKPVWLEAWDTPWSCVRVKPRPLESTDECAQCPNWTPRTNAVSTQPWL